MHSPRYIHSAPGSRGGYGLTRALVLLALIGGAAAAVYLGVRERRLEERCRTNLQHIYLALEMYGMDQGRLPNMAFFPSDPRYSEDSLLVVLEKYGVGSLSCVCPKAHRSHQDLGLTYLWNTALNGKELHGPDTPEWAMVELSAMSSHVPAPHRGRYHILYSDGRVLSSPEPPPLLREH